MTGLTITFWASTRRLPMLHLAVLNGVIRCLVATLAET